MPQHTRAKRLKIDRDVGKFRHFAPNSLPIQASYIFSPFRGATDRTYTWVIHLMWTYILGPFLALLPKDWRNSLPFHNHVDWARAISISGFLEFFAAIICLGYWYV